MEGPLTIICCRKPCRIFLVDDIHFPYCEAPGSTPALQFIASRLESGMRWIPVFRKGRQISFQPPAPCGTSHPGEGSRSTMLKEDS